MIKSMTGFGKAEGVIGNRKYNVEIRALNSKQFDLNLRMPNFYKEKEMDLRNFLARELVRGKIDVTIYYEAMSEEKKVVVNRPLLVSYHEDLKAIADEIGQKDVDYMALMMRIPDALKPEKQELDETEWEAVLQLIKEAVAHLESYRSAEGEMLKADFQGRIELILTWLKELEGPMDKRITRIRERIKMNLTDFIEAEKIDENRFEQELIFYIEKIDITEEQVRLESNCKYFLETLEADSSQGKKLGFIAQEIGREINTIGSKANDADIQRKVVQMKDELEKIKEQVLNAM